MPPVPMILPNHAAGAPGPSLLGTGGIDTMQMLASTRTLNTSTTPPPVCPLSAAPAHPPISTGKERDTESGNDYFGARYYASSMGRWMSPDPSMESEILEIPQTWNRYSYVYNRPTYGTDPDGRCPPCVGALIGGGVGPTAERNAAD